MGGGRKRKYYRKRKGDVFYGLVRVVIFKFNFEIKGIVSYILGEIYRKRGREKWFSGFLV